MFGFFRRKRDEELFDDLLEVRAFAERGKAFLEALNLDPVGARPEHIIAMFAHRTAFDAWEENEPRSRHLYEANVKSQVATIVIALRCIFTLVPSAFPERHRREDIVKNLNAHVISAMNAPDEDDDHPRDMVLDSLATTATLYRSFVANNAVIVGRIDDACIERFVTLNKNSHERVSRLWVAVRASCG